MEEATSNDDSNIAPVTHSSLVFDGKRLVLDEMDFFAQKKKKKKKNVVPDDEMVHQMELHVDVGKLMMFFLFFFCLCCIKYIDKSCVSYLL